MKSVLQWNKTWVGDPKVCWLIVNIYEEYPIPRHILVELLTLKDNSLSVIQAEGERGLLSQENSQAGLRLFPQVFIEHVQRQLRGPPSPSHCPTCATQEWGGVGSPGMQDFWGFSPKKTRIFKRKLKIFSSNLFMIQCGQTEAQVWTTSLWPLWVSWEGWNHFWVMTG